MDKKVGGPAGLVGYSEELSHDIVELDQDLLGNELFERHSSPGKSDCHSRIEGSLHITRINPGSQRD